MTVFIIVAVWFALSLVVAVLVGRVIGGRPRLTSGEAPSHRPRQRPRDAA
jgi:hypothetical protein